MESTTATTVAAPSAPTTSSTLSSAPTATAPVVTSNELAPGSWTAGFDDGLKGYITNKGFKNPGDLANSYQNLEKLLGAPKERLVKLPEAFYDDKGGLTPEGREIYERLGAPKDAKEYGLDKFVPKEGGDAKLMEHFSSVFKEAGVTKAAAEKIVTSWNELQNMNLATQKEAAAAKFKDSETALKKDWGMAFDQNSQIAKEGLRRLGHTAETADALSAVLGHAETMKLYHQLGSAVGESAFVTASKQASGPLDPGSARAQIAALKADKGFIQKYTAGDTEAVAKFTRLHEQAAAGAMSNF